MTPQEFDQIKQRDRDLGQPLDLSPLDESEIDRRNLIAEVERLREDLRIEKFNHPFHKEISDGLKKPSGRIRPSRTANGFDDAKN